MKKRAFFVDFGGVSCPMPPQSQVFGPFLAKRPGRPILAKKGLFWPFFGVFFGVFLEILTALLVQKRANFACLRGECHIFPFSRAPRD